MAGHLAHDDDVVERPERLRGYRLLAAAAADLQHGALGDGEAPRREIAERVVEVAPPDAREVAEPAQVEAQDGDAGNSWTARRIVPSPPSATTASAANGASVHASPRACAAPASSAQAFTAAGFSSLA